MIQYTVKFWKTVCIVVACAGALFCGAILTLVAMRRPWIAPVRGVRLDPVRPPVPLSELGPDSAFRLLVQAADFSGIKTDLPSGVADRILTQAWSELTFSNVVMLLEEAQTNLALFARAAGAEDQRAPLPPALDWIAYPDSQGTDKIKTLLTVSALRRTAAGDCAGALEDVKLLMRGGAVRGLVVSFEGYQQAAYCRRGCAALRRMACHGSAAQPVVQDALDFLHAFEQELVPWHEVVRMQHAWFKGMLPEIYGAPDEVWVGVFDRRFALLRRFAPLMGSNPTVTQQSMDALFSHAVVIAERPYAQAAYASLGMAVTCSPWELLISADPFGRALARLMFSSMDHQHSLHAGLRADLGLTRLVLALSLYEAQHGAPPATAADLTLEYLDAVPVDPFHEPDPLRYVVGSNGTWLAYSVGPGGVDDGGRADAGRDGPDIAVSSESDLLLGVTWY